MAAITTFLGQIYPQQAVQTKECKKGGRGNDREQVAHVHYYVLRDQISVLTDNRRDIHVQVDGISAEQVVIVAAAVQLLFARVKDDDAFNRFWMDVDLTSVDMPTLRTITPRSMLTDAEDPIPTGGAVYSNFSKQLCLWQALSARAESIMRTIYVKVPGRVENYLDQVYNLIDEANARPPPALSKFYDKANNPDDLVFLMIPPDMRVGAEVAFYADLERLLREQRGAPAN